MFRPLLALALLAVPGIALAQKPADASASDKKLAELEARLQSLLKEIQSLRGSTAESPKKVENKDVVIRIPRIEKLDDLAKLKDLEKLRELKGLTEKIELKGLAEMKDKIRVIELPKGETPRIVARLGEDKKPAVVEVKPGGTVEKRVVISDEKGGNRPAVYGIAPAGASGQGAVGYYVGSDPNTVHLTRVTYSLSAEQARALDEFLKGQVKAKVLETKVEGDKLIVTTTPDVQTTISQVVALVTGKPSRAAFQYQWTPRATGQSPAPAVKAVPPTPPTPPAVPKAPTPPKKKIEKDDD